jgi:hypothetical protein
LAGVCMMPCDQQTLQLSHTSRCFTFGCHNHDPAKQIPSPNF